MSDDPFESAMREGLARLATSQPAPVGLDERLVEGALRPELAHGSPSILSMRRWLLPIVAALAVVAVAAAVALVNIHGRATHNGSPGTSAANGPALPVPTGAYTDQCTQPYPEPGVRINDDVLVVPSDPIAVTVIWYPGTNAGNCTEPITRGSAALAQRLARDVAAATRELHQYGCLDDDGKGARLYFTYAHHPVAVADLAFDVCDGIRAPGSRVILDLHNADIFTALAPLSPLKILHGG